jgi:hypothetical protein
MGYRCSSKAEMHLTNCLLSMFCELVQLGYCFRGHARNFRGDMGQQTKI